MAACMSVFDKSMRSLCNMLCSRSSVIKHVLYSSVKNNSVQCRYISTKRKTRRSFSSAGIAILAISGLGIGGGVYGYLTAVPDRKNRVFVSATHECVNDTVLLEVPGIKPSRRVSGPAENIGLDLTLFQYQTCPFCCKVRAYLDFLGIPYDIVEVNPVLRKEIRFSKYKKVPILIADDKKYNTKHQLNDSTVIISALGTYLLNPDKALQDALKYYKAVTYTNDEGKPVTEVMNRYFLMYGDKYLDEETTENIREERKWRKWVDDEFVHVLSPNIYRSQKEALQAFNYFSDVGEWEQNFSTFERNMVIYVGAFAMYFVGKRLKKRYSLKDDVRESLYDACKMWTKAVGSKRKFMGGDTPNLADLSVYGVLSSVEGCAAFQDILSHTTIGPWYFHVKETVANHKGVAKLNLNKEMVKSSL